MEKAVIQYFKEIVQCLEPNPDLSPAHIANLRINNFEKLYKGNNLISFDGNLRYSIGQGYLMLRPFERVSVTTGFIIKHIPQGMEIGIVANSEMTLTKGNLILDIPAYGPGYSGAVELIIYNSCNFLNRLEVGDKIGELICNNWLDHVEFISI